MAVSPQKRDRTERFPTIAATLRTLDAGNALLDGKIISEDAVP
jgi:ATP-dependent DNA ligase